MPWLKEGASSILVTLENDTKGGKIVKITEAISDIQEYILTDKHQQENELSQTHTILHLWSTDLIKTLKMGAYQPDTLAGTVLQES